jgi:hypothetical protein
MQRAVLAGYDWTVSLYVLATALSPERVTDLVSYADCDIILVKRLGHSFPQIWNVLSGTNICFSTSAAMSA